MLGRVVVWRTRGVGESHLINNFTVINDYELEQVTYHHTLFDRHQVITANCVACESYLPGDQTMAGFNHDTQKEILNLFPALREDLGNYCGAARPLIKGLEALPLLAAMAA